MNPKGSSNAPPLIMTVVAFARRGLRLLAVVLWLTPLGLLYCGASSTLPGTALGTYTVTGQVSGNACGASLNPTNPYNFNVALSQDGSTLYWQYTTESTYSTGTLDASNQATITVSNQSSPDDADPCSLSRTDTIVVTLNAATSPTAFTGTLGYAFAAANNTDCSSQLSSSGGSYQTLPCTVTYSLIATKQ